MNKLQLIYIELRKHLPANECRYLAKRLYEIAGLKAPKNWVDLIDEAEYIVKGDKNGS